MIMMMITCCIINRWQKHIKAVIESHNGDDHHHHCMKEGEATDFFMWV